MGILDSLKTRPGGLTNNSVVVLTPLGKTKSENFDLPKAKWRLMSLLNENGACSVSELADESGMDIDRTRAACTTLIATGYIMKATTSE